MEKKPTRVSICTPTYNRRKFMKHLIKFVEYQDYPKELIQWVIVDDGEDKIEDLVENINYVLYVPLPEKVPLGNKRNIMHKYVSGSIVVYMDDDDYYPPSRVSHAVEMLTQSSHVLCAGCSKIYVYFTDRNETYSFGPYHNYHSTANTFAFKIELLKFTRYEDDATISEEKHFLRNYTIPLVQLNTMKTILSISHSYNTFDKKQILQYAKKSKQSINYFIKSGFSPTIYS